MTLRDTAAEPAIFDVGIHERMPVAQLAMLGLQNIFGMTGMLVFPGLLGRSFGLPPEQIAYLYGMTFATCGLITILQSVWLLRLPIVQGPYAGSFAALLIVGHLAHGGLGAAYGSLLVASIIYAMLAVPIRGRSLIGPLARLLNAPLISGVLVMLIMIQVANIALPNWIGLPVSPGFPALNIGAGAIAVSVLIAVSLWGGRFRRAAILIGLAAGTLCYALVKPISLAAVASAPILVTPQLFPFGFSVQPDLVIIFLLVLVPPAIGSMALYHVVAEWGKEPLPSGRVAQGILAVALGSIVVGLLGGFSTIAYPDNVGMLRTTRVGSRYATLAAGILLIVLGGCVKVDMLLVIVPSPVLSALATLLFGIVFMHGVHMLAKVEWNDRTFIVSGLAILIGLGGMFIAPATLQAMPLWVRLLLQQPVISGGLTLVVLYALLCVRDMNGVAKVS